MEREDILRNVAPCSLICTTCVACQYGTICVTADTLKWQLHGFKEFCARNHSFNREWYEHFEKYLNNLCNARCPGCRNSEHNSCGGKYCFIPNCVKEHNVDFCGECPMFPCDKVNSLFDNVVLNRWLAGNTQIKEVGAEEFLNDKIHEPHYAGYAEREE